MRAHAHLLDVATEAPVQVVDITARVQELVAGDEVREGVVVVSSRHTTTAIAVNEPEPGLLEDLAATLARLVPAGQGYRHDDLEARGNPPGEPMNAHAHLQALLLGSSEAVPVVEGRLALGTYQALFLVELDGPRRRQVSVLVLGA